MIDLRRAIPDDAATMATIHIEAWRRAYHGLVPYEFLAALDHEQRTKRFRGFLETSARDSYIIEVDCAPVGHLTIGPCRDDDLDGQTVGEIRGIYLLPSFWRKGIGSEVCRRAEEMLAAQGFDLVVLWVFAGNDAARCFYEAMGYVPDGETKMIDVGADLPAVRYRKRLTDRSANEAP